MLTKRNNLNKMNESVYEMINVHECVSARKKPLHEQNPHFSIKYTIGRVLQIE